MRARAIGLVFVIACGGGEIGDDTPGDGPGNNPGDGPNNNPGDSMAPRDVPGGVGEPVALAGITLLHNQVRDDVQTSDPLPFMTWNDDLAATAAAWAAQCVDQDAPIGLIDHNDGRSDGHPYYVGENIYGSGGTATAQGAVTSWASERVNYTYPTGCAQGKVCGHYTQIVWRTSIELGCAVGDCPGQFGNSIVCNYGPGGNSGGPPY
jgi:uncharacterized protein YkwD